MKENPVRPVYQSQYPTLDSLQEAAELSYASVPVLTRNDIHALLMTYHNTLLSELQNAYTETNSSKQ